MMTPEEIHNWAISIKNFESPYIDDIGLWFCCNDINFLEKILDIAAKSSCEVMIKIKKQKMFYGLKFSSALDNFISSYEGISKPNKSGLPDLSLVTCRQITAELKKRKNLTFVMFWIEEDYYDNINVEASGHLNTVVGLATRGLNLILKATDERTNYSDPEAD